MLSFSRNLSLLTFAAGISVLALTAPAHAVDCSVSLTNAVGDRISVSALLDATDTDELTEGESLTVASSGGELSGNLAIYELWYPFKSFKAQQVNETIQGTITNSDGDETCTISASTQPSFSYETQSEFEAVNESVRRLSLVYSTVLHICDVGGGNPTICAQHFEGSSLIMDSAAFLAGVAAKTSEGADFTQIALRAFLDVELRRAGHQPDALGDAFFALKDNSKRVLALEIALATTAARANTAAAKRAHHWERVQRDLLVQYRKQLGQALLDQASLSQALSQAVNDATADLNIQPSDVQAAQASLGKGLNQKQIAHLEKLGCNPNDIPIISRAYVMQDPNTFSGTFSGFLVDPTYIQSLQTLGQRLLS